MKKLLVVTMLASLLALAGCGKGTEPSVATAETEAPKESEVAVAETTVEVASEEADDFDMELELVDLVPGVYQDIEVNDIDDGSEDARPYFFYYLVLNEDGTGTFDGQDTIPLTWDAKSITSGGTTYDVEFNGLSLTLKDGEIETNYSFLEDVNIDEFVKNRDNPEYMFEIEDAIFMLSSFVEEEAKKNSFADYDELISYLKPGQAYAYVDVYGLDKKALFITEGVYDNGGGKMATIEAYVYNEHNGKITYDTICYSDGTARPLAVKDGIIYCAAQHSMSAYFYSEETEGIMCKMYVSEEFDTEGNSTYSGFYRETNSFDDDNEKQIETEEEFTKCYNEYFDATPIEFTVVE